MAAAGLQPKKRGIDLEATSGAFDAQGLVGPDLEALTVAIGYRQGQIEAERARQVPQGEGDKPSPSGARWVGSGTEWTLSDRGLWQRTGATTLDSGLVGGLQAGRGYIATRLDITLEQGETEGGERSQAAPDEGPARFAFISSLHQKTDRCLHRRPRGS